MFGTVDVAPIIGNGLKATLVTLTAKGKEPINILINCGWDVDFNANVLELYEGLREGVDLLLITDGDFDHVGALLWLLSGYRGRLPRVYCTEGSYKYARAALVDVLDNVTFSERFSFYNVRDLDLLNESVVKFRYRETCYFEKADVKISLSPINNGYSVGGALWHITFGFKNIICGHNFRTNPSLFLNALDIDQINKPDLLVIADGSISSFPFGDGLLHPTSAKGSFNFIAGDHARVENFEIGNASETEKHSLEKDGIDEGDRGGKCNKRGVKKAETKKGKGKKREGKDEPPNEEAHEKLGNESACNQNESAFSGMNLPFIEDHEALLDLILSVLMSEGNVLIPVDVDSVLISIIIYLNSVWSSNDMSRFRIVLASPVADKLLLLMGTCLEYMRHNICHNFIKTLWNPLLNLDYIDVLTSLDQLNKYKYTPTVFISTSSSINFGYTNFIFAATATFPKNLILLVKHNRDVLKYISNNNEFLLKINNQRDDDASVEDLHENIDIIDEEEEELEPDKFVSRHFINLNGRPIFAREKSFDKALDDVVYMEDYGLPHVSVELSEMNQLGAEMDGMEDEQQLEIVHEHNLNEEYYKKYMSMAQEETIILDQKAKRDDEQVIIKKILLQIKCKVTLTNCFNIKYSSYDLHALLHYTRPSSVVLLPGLTNNGGLERYLMEFSSRYRLFTFFEGGFMRSRCSVALDVFNYPIRLDDSIISSLRMVTAIAEAKVSTDDRKNIISSIIRSIDSWRVLNNKQKVFQVIARLEANEEHTQDTKILRCSTFWSDKIFNPEFKFKDIHRTENKQNEEDGVILSNCLEPSSLTPAEVNVSHTSTDDAISGTVSNIHITERSTGGISGRDEVPLTSSSMPCVKMGVDSSRYVGSVNMSTCLDYLNGCLSVYPLLNSGVIMIGGRVKVKKTVGEDSRWELEGTLDPSYYLTRKILTKLHYKIEPIY